MIKKTTKLPKISIIMPSFNVKSFIERAIKSVIEQDYPDYQLFIKDGGSKDGSIEIIKKYAKKYPKKIQWISAIDKGQADAINKGIKKINGDIVGYLNSDDVYKKDAFKEVGNFFKKNHNKVWVIGKCDIIDTGDKPIRGWITAYKNFWLKNYSYQILLILNFIPQMGVFWRRKIINDVGLFDINQHYVMDYDYWLRLGKATKPGVIDKYLASFRISESSKSSTGFVDEFRDEYKIVKNYTKNKSLLYLHRLHIKMVTSIYKAIRLLS